MSHHGKEHETGLAGKVDELSHELHHTTEDNAHQVGVRWLPSGKAVYTESVAPIEHETLPETVQFPDLTDPAFHRERARYYHEEAEKWRTKLYSHDEGLNAKKHNELMGKAAYHEAMAKQHEGLKVPKEHPNPMLPVSRTLEEGPRVRKGKGAGQVMGTGVEAEKSRE